MAVPIVSRAEDFYAPAPPLRPDAWDLIPPAERVIAYLENMEKRGLPRPDGVDPDALLIARVDAGRWVAQCPVCLSAQVVSPADPRFWCVGCQPGVWTTLRFPDDVAAVEGLVAGEPLKARRFWWASDDTAYNRPRPRPPITLKQQAEQDLQNSMRRG
ncbi:hypothetical protein [Streptomyces wuyuanensis]|uniref:Uncharacterized protein n=1 Tax=Streptomyces wuyuanensis TaxID=1196353 RepID=A0A1G9Z963_9ACTN|nr:hypothetical protein [Streptomyces wuyuanensis]SDN17687.1 hypothetical protein SAMN05444921_12117 [Streptomyces wuyuanensis]